MFEFEAFPKIPRLKAGVVITEKLDGTNAQIAIYELGSDLELSEAIANPFCIATQAGLSLGDSPLAMFAGSRNRWIKPGKDTDNYGFAQWAWTNCADLFRLGPGRHFGEWYGGGIGRAYGLDKDDKRFALFNTARWNPLNPNKPACCEVVKLITDRTEDEAMDFLALHGSLSVLGFMNPEGIVVYHSGSRSLFKRTFENDGGKWAQEKAA